MKTTFKALALAATFLVPQMAIAAGGNTPVPGIDIIIKEAGVNAPISERDLKAINGLKGMEKPALIGKIAAGYVDKALEGQAPKGGWGPVLSKGLIAEWCLECRGGDTVIKAMPAEGKEPIVIIISIAE